MKILQKIKQAFSCCPGDDSDYYPLGQCSYNKKTAYFTRLLPYGISSLEPEGSFVLIINSQGHESVKYGIPSAMMDRFKGLKEGEVALYNSITGVYVFLKEDGTVEINTNTTIDGDLDITGNLNVSGDVNISGNLVVNGVDFSTHFHGNVTNGSGDTDGPES